MSMDQAIRDFPKQFTFEPVVENAEFLKRHSHAVICGMGGSNLASGLLQVWKPELSIYAHRDYGLPALSDEEFQRRLVIASSYSGNTEETISSFEDAISKGCAVAVSAVGGTLIELAKTHNVPYVQMPNTGIQPRAALGLSLRALMKLMGLEDGLAESRELSERLDATSLEQQGKSLAKDLRDHVPVIYTSGWNAAIGYNWKIKLNETGKIPAFVNVLPELNHNEMTGFDVQDASQHLSKSFHFLILSDRNDHPQIQKRMQIVKKLYEDRGLPVTILELSGNTVFEKIFSSLLLADWTAFYTSQGYGLESEQVPMVEEFKAMIA